MVFSLAPRPQGLCGCAKYTCIYVCCVNNRYSDISLPRLYIKESLICFATVSNKPAKAQHTVCASWPFNLESAVGQRIDRFSAHPHPLLTRMDLLSVWHLFVRVTTAGEGRSGQSVSCTKRYLLIEYTAFRQLEPEAALNKSSTCFSLRSLIHTMLYLLVPSIPHGFV